MHLIMLLGTLLLSGCVGSAFGSVAPSDSEIPPLDEPLVAEGSLVETIYLPPSDRKPINPELSEENGYDPPADVCFRSPGGAHTWEEWDAMSKREDLIVPCDETTDQNPIKWHSN